MSGLYDTSVHWTLWSISRSGHFMLSCCTTTGIPLNCYLCQTVLCAVVLCALWFYCNAIHVSTCLGLSVWSWWESVTTTSSPVGCLCQCKLFYSSLYINVLCCWLALMSSMYKASDTVLTPFTRFVNVSFTTISFLARDSIWHICLARYMLSPVRHPSSSIWPHLSYSLVRSKREYYQNCSLVVLLCSFL